MLPSIVIAVCLAAAASAVPSIGSCPTVESKATLDAIRYVGTWYELKRFPNLNQGDLRCTSAVYTFRSDGKVGVRNQGYTVNGTIDFIEGTAQLADPAKPAELSVDLGFGWPANIPNYFVLETDYDSYTAIYSCAEVGPIKLESAWILTRERDADIDVSAVEQVFTDAGVDVSYFESVDQQNCP